MHVALVALLAAALAAILGPGRRVRVDRAEVLRALRASQGPRLPGPAACGARARTELVRYDRDTLYELVDGAAEGYLARGFEACVASTYSFSGAASPLDVAAEAHRFASAEGARAQLRAERPASAAPLAVPGAAAAESDGTVLLAVAGRDLLKLTRLAPDARGSEALAALARAWLKETSP